MMKLQNYEIKNQLIKEKFNKLIKETPSLMQEKLKFSWSNWGFGREPFEESCARLQKTGIHYIELHGNHYGPDLGYKAKDIKKILDAYGLEVSGICGMFSPEYDLSAPSGIIRENAIDYIKREVEFMAETGGTYLLIVPGAVGRPNPYDNAEIDRSIESLTVIAELLLKNNIKGAIEPIRSVEVSIVHTVKETISYLEKLNSNGIQWINGDVYHMWSEEAHLTSAILEAGSKLVNLHLADSNRGALGTGFKDLDMIIRALYLIDYYQGKRFVTPEPLGKGGNPYPAMHGYPDARLLDEMVKTSYDYFREREEVIKAEAKIAES